MTNSGWAVHIQGMDEVLPALGRRDAYERAHALNKSMLRDETDREPSGLDEFRSITWAVPKQGSPHEALTVAQVEDAWKRWAE